ncbi:tetratricopeptide repeat protein [Streptomyces scabiei]|uniref:tetratricopeptide repeat protein n=1 Tax=Streptomyces scabiei TaxID=1930 RepID=UPI0029AC0EF7|nr:tetratricopeptide repeat protein [Streptomyces scabiei]MDX2630674.1 tetratricopeptide repeat protein [Streptomyces scabiei]MDX2630675.1 tetratricopeptide repeat protein [Streptomyces scabiei]
MTGGRDLRALFSTNDRSVQAAETFTNRQTQWETVAAALTQHLQHVGSPGFDPEDLEAPRGHVLVFHGVGGIGKTTLSRTLEAALADAGHRPAQWGAPGWPADRILPVRIDLARSAGTDFEQIVLTIRAALTKVGRPLPAFDLALRRYWEANHPGEPLEEYLRRGGPGSRFGQALPQQMQSALSDVAQALMLPGTIGSVVGQVTGALVGALRERRQTVRALAGCARLADLLEAEPDLDALSFYPHLLAWELARLPEGKRVVPIVLLDTFEDIGDRTRRDLERLVQRAVWLLPNAFWVITGRSRLQWADPALQGQLDYTGPAAWPGLVHTAVPAARTSAQTGTARQVLIGDFSPEDCDDYLARRLTRGGQPLISDPVRQVITARSHGLPLYLDLSVARFLELSRNGRTPQPGDFDHDFPALVARTLTDLTPDERHVLRSVSLLDAFDVPLATQAAGLAHEGPALRLTERPFVREDSFGLWPFHLHGLIRSAVRNADDTTDDRWSERDWQQAAQRAFTTLGEQHHNSPGPGRLLLIACLRQGLRLARDHRLDLGWLIPAAWTYVSDSVWEPLAPPDTDNTGLNTAADALVELLSALARRQHQHRSHTAARLTTVIDSHLLPDDLHHMALYYRAKAHRDLGDSPASRTGMQAVADGQGRLAPAARRGLAHLARMAGDFPTALTTAHTLGWEGRHHRVQGDIWWPHGDMDRAAVAYAAARDEAEHHGVTGERGNSQAHRAFALAFADPAVADSELALAEQLLTSVDLRATTLITHIAALARDAGRTDADIDDRAQVLRADIRTAGVTYTELALDLALAFHHAVRNDQDQVAATIARLRENTRGGDFSYYTDIAAFMAGLPLEAASRARWLDGQQPTRQRWRTLVTTRRDHLHVPR